VSYEVSQILDSILGACKEFGRGERYYFCPFCQHHRAKFAVNVIKSVWQCWKCGQKGRSLVSLLYKLRASREDIAEMRRLLNDFIPPPNEEDPPLVLPTEYIPLWKPSNALSFKKALSYIVNRGITKEDIIRYQIGYCTEGRYAQRIIVPSYDENGGLNFFVGRDYSGAANVSYLNPPVSKNVIGFDYHINWNYPIVLVEGMFDAIATKRNAIPLIGKYPSKKLQQTIIEKSVKDVYVALDTDALTETIRISEKLINNGVSVWIVELHGKDPSAIGSKSMHEMMRNSKKVSFMDLIQLKMQSC
jgi:hypothetical protein